MTRTFNIHAPSGDVFRWAGRNLAQYRLAYMNTGNTELTVDNDEDAVLVRLRWEGVR